MIELIEFVLALIYWTLRELDPVPGDAGMIAYEFWTAQLDAIRSTSTMTPARCRVYEDYVAMQVITGWFNVILEIIGSALRFPLQCLTDAGLTYVMPEGQGR